MSNGSGIVGYTREAPSHCGMLEAFGPFQVREPFVKPLGEELFEIRMKGKDGVGRAVYMAATGQRLVVLHAFIKKTPKTPRSAIRTALERAKEVVWAQLAS
jgi:phage-related protein